MKVRKFPFAVLMLAALIGGSFLTERAGQQGVGGPCFVADGSDPMPFPRPTRGTAVVADEAAAGVLLADGSDPMPSPRPRLG
jgi:hypothetical protein